MQQQEAFTPEEIKMGLTPTVDAPRTWSPEQHLLAELVAGAIGELRSGRDPKTLQSRRAAAWAWLSGDTSAPISFAYCCAHLGLDASALLRDLHAQAGRRHVRARSSTTRTAPLTAA